VFVDLVRFLVKTAIISLNSFNYLIFLMVKCGVLFEVRTEFLNITYTRFGFEGLILHFVKKGCYDFLIILSLNKYYLPKQQLPL
jgi:hypothetical protein